MSGPTSARASRDRHVVLADVHAVGAHLRGDVGAVVEDEQRAVRFAHIGRHACGFGEEAVVQALLAQLHDVDAAGDRRGQEVLELALTGHAVAHEIQPRGGEACAAVVAGGVGHRSQVGIACKSDTGLASTVMSENTALPDVAIVGGGIVGLSTAWRARAQGLSVTLLERDHVGRGTSHVAAGMLAPVAEVEFGEAGRRVLELGLRSAEMWPGFAAELEEAADAGVGLRQTGTLVVARDEDEARELERQLDVSPLAGPARRAAARERGARARAGACADRAARAGGAGRSQRRSAAGARRAAPACELAGVSLREHTAVASVELDEHGERVIGLLLHGGERVRTAHIVLAAGPWSGQIEGCPPPRRSACGRSRARSCACATPRGRACWSAWCASRAAISCRAATAATCWARPSRSGASI